MSDRRRNKALQAILRASQYEIDQIASLLADVRSQESEIAAKIVALDKRRDHESYSPSIEAQPFVTTFLEAVSKERLQLSHRLFELEKISSELESRVRDKFLERQRWKATQDKLQASLAYDERRIEERHTNEFASIRFGQARAD